MGKVWVRVGILVRIRVARMDSGLDNYFVAMERVAAAESAKVIHMQSVGRCVLGTAVDQV